MRELYLTDHGFLRTMFQNWRTVGPGMYRSNQPSPGQIARMAEKGIKTILNLRGKSDAGYYHLEKEAAAKHGIEVVDVRIKRIDLPDEVSESVYRRMRAERTKVANELRSQGTEQGETIRAKADKERQVTLAEAGRDAAQARGEGEAEAAKIYAAAYTKDPEFYAFYRSLEAYRESFRNKDGVLVLDPDSEFFKYFGEGAAR